MHFGFRIVMFVALYCFPFPITSRRNPPAIPIPLTSLAPTQVSDQFLALLLDLYVALLFAATLVINPVRALCTLPARLLEAPHVFRLRLHARAVALTLDVAAVNSRTYATAAAGTRQMNAISAPIVAKTPMAIHALESKLLNIRIECPAKNLFS